MKMGLRRKSLHICGKEIETTRNKPLCYDCYKKHKDELDFFSFYLQMKN